MAVVDRLSLSTKMDEVADEMEQLPELMTIGSEIPNRLRGLAALLRGEPTHTRERPNA